MSAPTLDAGDKLNIGPAATRTAPEPLRLLVHQSLSEAEALWRDLEERAVLTPYQRFDWLAAYASQPGPGQQGRLVLAFLMQGDRAMALLPLQVRRRFGVNLATLFGTELGGLDWMLVAPEGAAELTPQRLQAVLSELADAAGPIDILMLTSQPEAWLGLKNPLLAFRHQPGPDHLYIGGIDDAPNSKRLRNILRGKRRLEESFGPVRLAYADTPEQIDRIHAAFLEQRGKRLAEQGIANFFAERWVRGLFRDAACRGLEKPLPPFRLHALFAGDQIVATSCGTYCGPHYSQYINSTTDGPAAKSSLMGLLMHELRAELASEGITTTDLGLGDFDYKTDWTAPKTVYDAVLPLSLPGRLLAPLLRNARRLKRAVKQNRRLLAALKRLRALLRKGRVPG